MCPPLSAISCWTLYRNTAYGTEIELVVCELGLAGGVPLSNTSELSTANCSGGYVGWVMKNYFFSVICHLHQ